MEKNKTDEQTRTFSRMVADKHAWILNPDTEFYEMLIDGLTKNYNRYGYYLCPCRDTEGSREADKSALCPCIWSKDDIDEFGHCYCALYLSKDFFDSGARPNAIPDRRYRDI
jgi:ferredoxin-thioredoxin reductase catalytic subunit